MPSPHGVDQFPLEPRGRLAVGSAPTPWSVGVAHLLHGTEPWSRRRRRPLDHRHRGSPQRPLLWRRRLTALRGGSARTSARLSDIQNRQRRHRPRVGEGRCSSPLVSKRGGTSHQSEQAGEHLCRSIADLLSLACGSCVHGGLSAIRQYPAQRFEEAAHGERHQICAE